MIVETDPGRIELEAGDIFFSASDSCWGKAIRAIEKLWAKDGKAEFNHAGVITNRQGCTFEALNSGIKYSHLDKRNGQPMFIARPIYKRRSRIEIPDLKKHEEIARIVARYNKKHYPWYRMPLHLFPPSTQLRLFGVLECSGVVADYLHGIGARHAQLGVNPDTLADEAQDWGNYQPVFKGVMQWET